MIFHMQTVRVDKVCARAAQLLCLGIHQFYKRLDVSGNVFGQNVGSGVVGVNHQHVQHIHKLHFFTGQKIYAVSQIIAIGNNVIDGRLAHCNGIFRVGIFHHQRCRHQFGGTGGIHLLVGIQRIQHRIGGCFIQQCRFCGHRGGLYCKHLYGQATKQQKNA